jgi:hypothetical protein
MDGNIILARVQGYLQSANDGAPGMSEETIQEAGERFKDIMRKTFNESRKGNFRMYMSNAGKPSCQLVMERNGAAKEAQPYSFRMKMLIGDITEITLRAVMKASGVPIDSSNQKVELRLNDIVSLRGEYDFNISGRIWDAKSSSGWTFKNKWGAGFDYVEQHDTFGYCAQLFGYAEAIKAKAGGWFVVNKETGEIICVEAKDTPEIRAKHLAKLEANVLNVLDVEKPFERLYPDELETFYSKPTGNRKLGFTCSMCEYKWSCWPGLKGRMQVKSEARNPRYQFYSVFDPKSEEVDVKPVGKKQGEKVTKPRARRNSKSVPATV